MSIINLRGKLYDDERTELIKLLLIRNIPVTCLGKRRLGVDFKDLGEALKVIAEQKIPASFQP